MKRLATAILVLVVAFWVVAGALAEEGLNLLWGIPFGASPDEVVYKAREVAGISLVETTHSKTWYEADDAQQISIMGVPVGNLWVQFDDKTKNEGGDEIAIYPYSFSSADIHFTEHYIREDNVGLREGIEELRSIADALRDKYGSPSYAYFMVIKGFDEKTRAYYEIPLSDSAPVDMYSPFKLLLNDYNLYMRFVFKNVSAWGNFDGHSWENHVSFSNQISERPIFSPYLIGEKKEFDLDELPEPKASVDAGF